MVFNHAKLTSEERIRHAVRATKQEMSLAYLEVPRNLPPAAKLANSNSLFIMARDARINRKSGRADPSKPPNVSLPDLSSASR